MSLKPDREIVEYEQAVFMDEVAEGGGPICASTYGSGHALDAGTYGTYKANPSGGVCLGVLLADVVDTAANGQRNYYGGSREKGSKVPVARKGWIVTNRIYTGVNPAGGDTAYVGQSGYFTNTQANGAAKVGRFETSKDEDGYAKVSIQIPQ